MSFPPAAAQVGAVLFLIWAFACAALACMIHISREAIEQVRGALREQFIREAACLERLLAWWFALGAIAIFAVPLAVIVCGLIMGAPR